MSRKERNDLGDGPLRRLSPPVLCRTGLHFQKEEKVIGSRLHDFYERDGLQKVFWKVSINTPHHGKYRVEVEHISTVTQWRQAKKQGCPSLREAVQEKLKELTPLMRWKLYVNRTLCKEDKIRLEGLCSPCLHCVRADLEITSKYTSSSGQSSELSSRQNSDLSEVGNAPIQRRSTSNKRLRDT